MRLPLKRSKSMQYINQYRRETAQSPRLRNRKSRSRARARTNALQNARNN